ncbi:MAG TPA: glycosyltransferase family 4 protein [Thermoanaerobaculia bacterium]|nr:glycosyltransferase family 4 protein [Thermoanaerobaculia bacterium]
MRIAYVCSDPGIPFLGFKGASVHVREITSALQRRGHSVRAAMASIGEGNEAPELSSYHLLPRDPAEQRAFLERFLAESRADVVLERYSLQSGPGRGASAKLGLGLVLEVNAPIVLEAAKFRNLEDVDGALEREAIAFRSAQAIAVVSRALEEYVRGGSPETPVTLVRNGVTLERFHPPLSGAPLDLPPDAIVVGFVGSMKPWHGVHDLFDAFALLADTAPSMHLAMVGTGPEEGRLRQRAREERHRDRIHLIGAVPHDAVPGVLARFDVAVAPYRPLDGFYFCPLKVLEYMAAGRPTVFPTLGDIPEIVGDAGIPYEPGSVSGLAGAISRLVSDEALRRALGRSALARSAELTWDRAAERIGKLLEGARAGSRAS